MRARWVGVGGEGTAGRGGGDGAPASSTEARDRTGTACAGTTAGRGGEGRRCRGAAGALAVVVALPLAAACGDGDPAASEPARLDVPVRLLLSGEAGGTLPNGRSIACYLDVAIDLVEESRAEGTATYTGNHGGHVGRSVRAGDGAGFAIDALVGGDARLQVRAPDRVDLEFPANEGAVGRFWAGLHLLEGRFDSRPSDATGDWSCSPFDVREGYVDTVGVATGRWRLEVP